MTLRKVRSTAWALGASVTAMALTTTILTANAATEQSAFTTHYNRNLQLETQLVQKAQAEGGSSSTITALSNTVQTINAQVAALYTSEQALATARATIPSQVPDSSLDKLKDEKQKLLKNIADAKAKIKADLKAKHTVEARKLTLQIKTWEAQVNQIDFQLNHPTMSGVKWKQHPYDNGLGELQQSIFDLQQSAIHYTEVWIAAAKPATSTGNPLSISGLSYSAATVTVPSAGSAAVTDGVAVMPIVKDAQGNILVDSGSFTLTGPAGASGVSIDATTGLISVNAGATKGTYAITYAQSGVSESVSVVVS